MNVDCSIDEKVINKESKYIYAISFFEWFIASLLIFKTISYFMFEKALNGDISTAQSAMLGAVATVAIALASGFIGLIIRVWFDLNEDKTNKIIMYSFSILGLVVGSIIGMSYMDNDIHDKFVEFDKEVTANNYAYNPVTADLVAYKKESESFTKCIDKCGLTLNKFYTNKNYYLLVDKPLSDALFVEYNSIKFPVVKDMMSDFFKKGVFTVGDKIFMKQYLTHSMPPEMFTSYPELKRILQLVSN